MTLEEQIAALTTSVNEGRAAAQAKFNALQASFDNWKPVVADLQVQVEALRIKVDRCATSRDLLRRRRGPRLKQIGEVPRRCGHHH
jgi:hypothetical protein